MREIPEPVVAPGKAPSRELALKIIGEQVDELLAKSVTQQEELDDLRAKVLDLERSRAEDAAQPDS